MVGGGFRAKITAPFGRGEEHARSLDIETSWCCRPRTQGDFMTRCNQEARLTTDPQVGGTEAEMIRAVGTVEGISAKELFKALWDVDRRQKWDTGNSVEWKVAKKLDEDTGTVFEIHKMYSALISCTHPLPWPASSVLPPNRWFVLAQPIIIEDSWIPWSLWLAHL